MGAGEIGRLGTDKLLGGALNVVRLSEASILPENGTAGVAGRMARGAEGFAPETDSDEKIVDFGLRAALAWLTFFTCLALDVGFFVLVAGLLTLD